MSGKLVKLVLKNFRVHAAKTLEFTPGVNVLVGDNDKGKSTVLKAIRWVTFNRPVGNSMVRWGKKECSVSISTEKHEVSRFKGGENGYQVDGGEPSRAVGTEVPKEVQDALRLDSVNFQAQIDPPFWLSLSAPEVAQEMNRIIDLSIIDRSMTNAAGKLRDATSRLKALNELHEAVQVKIGRLRWLPAAEARAKEALRCEQEASAKHSEAQRISRLVRDVREAQEATESVPDLSKVGPVIEKLKQVRSEAKSLERLIERIKVEQENLWRVRSEAEAAEKEADRIKPKLCPACGRPM